MTKVISFFRVFSQIVNHLLFPPAKIVFILWTILCFSRINQSPDFPLYKKIIVIFIGYFFFCGMANLIFYLNTERYLNYKLKLLNKKLKYIENDIDNYVSQTVTPPPNTVSTEKPFVRKIYTLNDFDTYFVEAGLYIIEKNKASIGMLQRAFRIGFNRAYQIMNQLEKVGVVGKEYGTLPREIKMSKEEFDTLLFELSTSDSSSTTINRKNELYNNNFDYMEGYEFEHFCADLLKKNGFYNIEVTQCSGDHGIDILAEKDGITYAIQCKCYSSNIGNAAIQQAHTGKTIYHRDIAVVFTNRYFTAQAIEEANILGVKLWDRDTLNNMLVKISL